MKQQSKQVALKAGPRLSMFFANMLGLLVFGSVWLIFNILLGNMVALRFLGWLNSFPLHIQISVALLPSSGQLLFEEHQEAQKRAKKEAERQGYDLDSDDEALDKPALAIIALLSTTLDVIGPTMGIIITVAALGGEIAIIPAVILAFLASWGCQRIAWRCLKSAIRMAFAALMGLLAAPFHTKTLRLNSKRRGHTPVFQHLLEPPQEAQKER